MAKTLKIVRGTTFIYALSGVSREGVPVDLTNATIRFTIKNTEYDDSEDDATAAIAKDVTNGTADGSAKITILPSDTRAIAPGDYFFDCKIDVNSDGKEIYLIDSGDAYISASSTNRM